MNDYVFQPIYLKLILINNKYYSLYAVLENIGLCICSNPVCHCGCTYDIQSFPKCTCLQHIRKCVNCNQKMTFCRNGLLLRCFLGQDMTNYIRFTNKCSCGNLECHLDYPVFLIRKEFNFQNKNYSGVFIINIYLRDINLIFFKASKQIHNEVIIKMPDILIQASLEYPLFFSKFIRKDVMFSNLANIEDK